MSTGDAPSLVVPATLDALAQVSSFLEIVLEEAGVDMLDAARIQLAVEEAIINVVNHGYGGKDGEICITSDTDHGRVMITITDTGPAFDPTTIPPPDITAELEDRTIGGLGVHLIRSVMDEVIYTRDDDKNRLTMIKRYA